MEIAKLLEHKHQPSSSSSLMTCSAMEPSSSSAFQKYTRLTTIPQHNDDSAASISKPLVAFPSFAWTNLSDPKSKELKNSTVKEEVKAYQSATTSNLLFFNGLSHRSTAARQPKKHSSERRPRTTFNVEQTCKLEDEYKKNEYVSRSKRVKLAQLLELSEGQVKIWFQNRRAKDKRIEKAQLDQRVRYIALNMAAMSCPGLLTATSTYGTSVQQEDDN